MSEIFEMFVNQCHQPEVTHREANSETTIFVKKTLI